MHQGKIVRIQGRGNLLGDYVSWKHQRSYTHDTSTAWRPKQDLNTDTINHTNVGGGKLKGF